MKFNKHIIIIFVIVRVINVSSADFLGAPFNHNHSCGEDKSPISVVYEGVAKIQTYPWMGYLFYPMGKKRFTTSLVLVTKQIALATATEIDKLPKHDFRARSRAVFGDDCSGPSVPVRDYSYHPDYAANTYSTLAMVQLETDDIVIELIPICPPPTHFIEPQFYAMALVGDCSKPVVKLYEMVFVNPEECKTYYRKSGLDVSTMWPTHTTCAKAVSGGECVWRSGAALVVKQEGKWRLLGFGVHGPGCSAPARFLDYGILHQWVRRSVVNIGRPAVWRVSPQEVILRRSLSNLQRYGPCDPEETKYEIYTDHTHIEYHGSFGQHQKTVRYNVTIVAGIEYSCVVFRASGYQPWDKQPKLHLRRWCVSAATMCSDIQFIEIEFYVEITFESAVSYDMKAYGRTAIVMDFLRATKYVHLVRHKPEIKPYEQALKWNRRKKRNYMLYWYW